MIAVPQAPFDTALWTRIAGLPVLDGPDGEKFLALARRVSNDTEETIREQVRCGALPYAFLAATSTETIVPPPAVGFLLEFLVKHPNAAVRDVFRGIEEPYFDTDTDLLGAYDRTLTEARRVFGSLPAAIWPEPSSFNLPEAAKLSGQYKG